MRRKDLILAAIGAALGSAAAGALRPAWAQAGADAWPVRTVRLVVPQAAGSPMEIPARMLAERVGRALGANLIIENRPGAGSGIGSQFVAQSAPDGSVFLVTSAAISTVALLQPALNFDPARDLEPVSIIVDVPSGLLVRNASPFADLPGLLRFARDNPGKLTYASGGVGSANHLAGALFASLAGVQLTHVPYRGVSQAVNAVYSGDIDLIFGSTLELLAHVRQGQARILGVTMPVRVPQLPDVPAIAELVPGYAAPNWFSIWAPKGTSSALIARLAAELAAARDAPELLARMAEGAATVRLDGPGPLAARLAEELPKWREVVANAGIKPD